MGKLSDKLANAADYTVRLQELKMKTATTAINQLMQSDQWKLAVSAMPDNQIAVDQLVETAVSAVTNPTTDFIDVLRARGFRQGEIRGLVRKLYLLYCVPFEAEEQNRNLLYEDMLPLVAQYCIAHQEVFASLDPESLRESK